jgi:hypothetical protein
LLMHEYLSIELGTLRVNSVGNHSCISYVFISFLCFGL